MEKNLVRLGPIKISISLSARVGPGRKFLSLLRARPGRDYNLCRMDRDQIWKIRPVRTSNWNAWMKKSKDEFLHMQMDDLRKAIITFKLCWKPLRSNFRNLFLIEGKIFTLFWVTLCNVLNWMRIIKWIKILYNRNKPWNTLEIHFQLFSSVALNISVKSFTLSTPF